jgi:hypothetical protein
MGWGSVHDRRRSAIDGVGVFRRGRPGHDLGANALSVTKHVRKPCKECPWRVDVPPGQFAPERFEALAVTAHDMTLHVFTCHKTPEDKPRMCAGFLLRGARHNLAVRLDYRSGPPEGLHDGGHALHPHFRAMALAQGVDPHSPALADCRDD